MHGICCFVRSHRFSDAQMTDIQPGALYEPKTVVLVQLLMYWMLMMVVGWLCVWLCVCGCSLTWMLDWILNTNPEQALIRKPQRCWWPAMPCSNARTRSQIVAVWTWWMGGRVVEISFEFILVLSGSGHFVSIPAAFCLWALLIKLLSLFSENQSQDIPWFGLVEIEKWDWSTLSSLILSHHKILRTSTFTSPLHRLEPCSTGFRIL